MPDRIKVMPNSPDAIGMAHPIDGPLAEDGGLWTYDDFTQRRFFDGSVVRFEQPPAEKLADVPMKPAKAVKADAAASPPAARPVAR